jgi:hypothetical protein
VQTLQQRVNQLERQMQETTARPSPAGASVAAASSSIPAAILCAPRQQSFSPLLTQLSIGQQLHKDALHCVFAYFSLTALPFVMRSCRAWCAAVRSLPLQNVFFRMSRSAQLYLLPFSASTPLARHIVKCDVRRLCTAYDLAQLLNCLPNLTALTHWLCRSTEPHPRLYPGQLRELNLDLTKKDEKEDVNALIAQMQNLSSAAGLRHLSLTLPYNTVDIESISLEPLECMKELASLSLLNDSFLPPAELRHVRRLQSLRTFSLDSLSERNMQILLQDLPGCPPLQLLAIEWNGWLNSKIAQLLVHMPTLQRVEPRSIAADALPLLAHGLPDLRTLTINLGPRRVDRTMVYDWPLVRENLSACRRLTTLTLVATPVDELAALLLALPPSMRKLDIRDCVGFLQSDALFQCVAEGGLRQLERLHVRLQWHEHEQQKVAEWPAWLVRLRACAPWINVVLNAI